MIEYENLAIANKKFETLVYEKTKAFIGSGRYVLGDEVSDFETSFAKYNGVDHCVGVGNGTDALTIALKATIEEDGPGEVIVPSNAYIATILPLIHLGLKPVLVEPDINTYNIKAEAIIPKLSKNTRAVLVCHMYGRPCEMDDIVSLCRSHNLQLLEDCSHAHGASYKGKKVGGYGTGAFSFYPTKNLGAMGDAGGITCSDKALAEKIRALRNYGSRTKNTVEFVGYSSRLDEFQAAVLNIKLPFLDEINSHKRGLAEVYFNELGNNFILPVQEKGVECSFHIFAVRHGARDRLREFLQKNGTETQVHYPVPPHKQLGMKDVLEGSFPISEEIHQTVLSLPISFGHNKEDIHMVCKTMMRF